MAAAHKFFLYADINCPFCYALNERLASLGLGQVIEWRGIEHDALASSRMRAPQELAKISKEVAVIRQRAPDVTLTLPSFRPSSAAALQAICLATAADPVKGEFFRTLIYRAFWVDGRDISDPAVLDDLRRLAGLPSLVADDRCRQRQNEWQRLWEEGAYCRRIPALCSADGEVLLGLSGVPTIESFIRGEQVSEKTAAVCLLRPRPGIGVLTGDDQLYRSLDAELTAEYNLQRIDLAAGVPGVSGLDLLILSVDQQIESLCRRLKADMTELPLLVLSDRADSDQEARLFDIGVADYVLRSVQGSVLRARVATQLRLKRTIDLLDRLARIDGLTEISNRREFERGLETEWMRGTRTGLPITLVMADIDSFKSFNDHYGHPAGDDCLRQVALLLDSVRKRAADLVARYGGEEFAFVLSDTDAAGGQIFVERILDKMRSLSIPHQYSSVGSCVSVSLGVATMVPDISCSPGVLLEAADRALYAAKQAGGNCWKSGSVE